MHKHIFYFSLFLFTYSFGYSQDPMFSQFYANRLYLNPGFAGTANCPRLTLNYRNQWPGIDNSYVTYNASYDQHVDVLSGGLGVLLLYDQVGEGVLNTTSASFMYSYQLNVNRRFSIRAGFQASFIQKAIDVSSLRFGDMIDARKGFVYETQELLNAESSLYPDFSFGLLGFSEKIYFGLAVHHLTEPDEGFIEKAPLPRRITGHFGAKLPTGIRHEDLSWSPNIIYQQQGEAREINLGVYFTKGPFVAGLWYRYNDAFMALVGIEHESLKIGYSYDMTTSLLSDKSAGSHEISLSYVFPCRPKQVKFKTIMCPSF